jgi:predicted nucleic acid-binding protein
MTTLLDSCFFVALLNLRDEKHNDAKKLLKVLKEAKYGSLQTTDYVVDEVLTTIWGHTHRKDLVINAYKVTCQKPEFVQFKKIKNKHFGISWEKWKQLAEWPKKPLSFTDCTILAYMEIENIEFLATFDTEFDGLVKIVNI